ncbi:hypothetical protein B0H13DRAFT_2418573 [Mycena leptocephala]|nr:hypothetical protein B0H13DRAFT_2418573 [Mycena leptocephala]
MPTQVKLSMAEGLPDELISEILSPAFEVHEDIFWDSAVTFPFASGRSVSSLLVCKAWRWVATRHLYRVVVIRSVAQARALCAGLRNNLVYLAGSSRCFGLKVPNITDIFISLEIKAQDSTTGLVSGLQHINPSRLLLFKHLERDNKYLRDLVNALIGCASKWTNLVRKKHL